MEEVTITSVPVSIEIEIPELLFKQMQEFIESTPNLDQNAWLEHIIQLGISEIHRGS